MSLNTPYKGAARRYRGLARLCDYQQVNVAVGTGVSASIAAKEDNLQGLHHTHNSSYYLLHQGIAYLGTAP
jgi:hypothetical protein